MMLEISPRDFLIPWPSHNVESRHLFASKDSKCTAGEHGGNGLAEVHGEIAYIDTRARVDPSARLHQCYIAPGATIGAGVELESSIIGPDVVVEAGASIRKCIIHARSTVSPSTSVECVVIPPNGSIIASNKAHPVDGVTIGTPLPDTAQALAKIKAVRVSREGFISTEEPTEEEDIANSSCGTDKAFKKGFRAEVYAFFKEGWYEKQDVSHVCQQLRIYRTTEQAPLSELLIATVLALARVCCEVLVSDSSKPKQPVVASFYEYWDDALEELYLTDQTGLSKWWIEALDNLCASCPQYGQDFEKECCLFIWGMYANDYLSKEDLLAWWSRAPDTYRQLPLMAQLIGQIEEQSDDDDSDDDSEDDSDSE
ncbi:hypothetical protein Pmar_PMAR010334 [Perkinsus marinus ATCC 50983]|uniref:W2 domain-containing protein n=1 Tax=Perkinsus marinus (strain ATCC 50983 / TXsc) TaxID=423536 RepID=C5KZU5_PERM5|nr:hypothetical protein Pmar_PMAR010334 [Perkinsus marinus ATCC 50983]EER09999.1 hypothetical protein Pmar_PMAR010334 [Perkinsus marinus ATCC 50983]|eukprot:XP_002778204.1 hypothetical protein Pmar_PMAR010334 [Perkinsus marinus ATCC 50983]